MQIFNNSKIYFYFRFRGVPSHLLGSSHGDDNSSENSTEEKDQPNENLASNADSVVDACVTETQPITNLQCQEIINDQFVKNIQYVRNDEQDNDDEQDKNRFNDPIKNCSKILHASINPPPGAPRQENSARLRRYRHNFE